MTTKYKIILGFTSMMIIMAVLAVLGSRYLADSLGGLVEYRRYARMNVQLSDSVSHLTAAGSGELSFLLSRDAGTMEDAMAGMDKMDALVAETEKEMTIRENLDTVAAIRKNGRMYKEGLAKSLDIVRKAQAVYEKQVLPNCLLLEEAILSMADLALKNNNAALLGAFNPVWNHYARMRSALGRLDATRSLEDLALVEENINALKPCLDQAGATIFVPETRVLYGELMKAFKAVFDAAAAMGEASRASAADVAGNRAVRTALSENVSALSAKLDGRMRDLGVATTKEIEEGQSILLGGSAVGVLAGLALALFIILGLVRVLKDLADYAGSVAHGDFTRQVKTREKGEIGDMVRAIRDIPAMMGKLIADARAMSGKILVGDYNARLNPSDFPGSFQDLAHSIASVSDSYTKILDQIPLAIFTGDLGHNLVYANGLTRKILGGDKTGQPCGACFNTPNCGTSECFGTRAGQEKRTVTGEVATHPASGEARELGVSAVPLLDEKGTVRGYMEICADITESRNRQSQIQEVTEQAAAISNRVATAAEELSAQVEQVSRGAEVQRDRMASTASAMAEMNATVLEVAKNAGEASEQSEGTKEKARQGAELVNQVMTAINAVNEVGQNMQNNMRELGKQAESIGNVMNVISDIADQTNLLALNAAIEAARAGEAGRGFAVVADEVRKLAEKTMQATQEVGTSIRAVQQSARVNIDEVGKAVASVAEANTLANSSGEALKEIVSMASSNSSVVASIATAAEEQSATSEEISQSVDEVNRIVGETSQGMVQSSAAVQELSLMAQELRQVMEGLK